MSEHKSRSATDVLLNLENEVMLLKQMLHNLNLNIKIISNKLNQGFMPPSPQINLPQNSLYGADIQDSNFLDSDTEFNDYEAPLSIETNPVGPRRTSRPTINDFKASTDAPTPSLPQAQTFALNPENTQDLPGARKQVGQRLVDKNSKAIFMANVEILNVNTNIIEIKTKTNVAGKWQASLAYGNYKVLISVIREAGKRVELAQDLVIDDNTPSDLKMVIIK